MAKEMLRDADRYERESERGNDSNESFSLVNLDERLWGDAKLFKEVKARRKQQINSN